MEVTFSTSEKGKSLLVIDGYTFSFHKMLVKDTVKRWQCSKRTCKAFVKTQTAEDTVVESVLDHNHEKLEPAVFNRKVVSNSLKRKAISGICEKPIKLIRSEINNTGIDTFTTKDIVRVRQNIYNARASALIKLPKNISDFHAAIESTPILPGPLPKNIGEVHASMDTYFPKTSTESLKLSTETSSETKLGLPYEDFNSDDQFSIEYSAAPRWLTSFNREDESISMVPQQTSNVTYSKNQPSSVEFNRTKIETLSIPTDATEYSLPVETKPSSIVLNDLDSYETYLISKLRSYNPTIRSKVQELFNEIIFNADTGVLNKNDCVPTSSPIHNISPEYVEIIPQDTSDKYFIKEEADSRFVEDNDLLKASSDFQDSPDLVSIKNSERSFEQHSKQYYQQRNNMKGSKKQVSTITTNEPPLQPCIPSSELSLSIKEEIFIEEHEMENINEEDNSFNEFTAYKSSITIPSKSMECPPESSTVKYEMPVKCEDIQIDK